MAVLAVQAGNKDTQMGFYKNDATAANNTSVNGIAIQGSSSPANIDNALRELAAQGKQFALDIAGATTVGGTADAITITANDSAADAYFDGMIIGFVAGSDNATTTPTANVNAIGAKTIKKALGSDGAELAVAAGDIQSGGLYLLRYRSAWASGAGALQLIDLQHPAIDNRASNVIINGDMRIDQRNAGAAVTIDATFNIYTVDRWAGSGQVTDGVFTVDQTTDAPAGFTNSLRITVTTADASIGATQNYLLTQFVEGFNCADFDFGKNSAKAVTLSFWARSSVTGTFGGVLQNNGNDRTYPFTYAISSANTWEYKTITIAGDTTGTWLTDNGRGLALRFQIGVGSSRVAASGAWTGTPSIFGATGATNIIETLNATWDITGVQLEAGDTATPFEHRLYGQELALCQKYYYKIFPGAVSAVFGPAYSFSTTGAQAAIPYPVTMRIAPTALEQSGTANHYAVVAGSSIVTCSAVPTHSTSTTNYSGIVNITVSSGLTNGYGGLLRSDGTNGANAYLGWSAEL